MASPALGSPFHVPLDPHKKGSYAVRLGDALTNRSSSTGSFSSVRFNHKPNYSNGTRSSKISKESPSQSTLKIIDKEDDKISLYKYSGHRSKLKRSYVLVFDEASQTCTLEPLDSSYNFNIQSTPRESSRSKLAQQYPQLQAKVEYEEEKVADESLNEDPNAEPDADNPFDYRHYLHAGRDPSRSPTPPQQISSNINTPNLTSSGPRPANSKVRNRPAAKADPLRPAPRKQANKPPAKPTPTVRLDRRASTRPGDNKKGGPKLPKAGGKKAAKSDYYVHSSSEDDEPIASQRTIAERSEPSDVEEEDFNARGGGLEIDFGGSPPTKRKNKALALPGTIHGGPISLHSAANSPNSRIVTPRQQQKKSNKNDDVLTFGNSNSPDDSDFETRRKEMRDKDVTMRDDSDVEGDDDVEPMSLGSPAHQQQAADSNEDAELDLDAEFEAEMLQGLAGDDDDVVGESEEESEAE